MIETSLGAVTETNKSFLFSEPHPNSTLQYISKSPSPVTTMGNHLQTDTQWYVYRRVLSTDQWVYEPVHQWNDIPLEEALSRFKHEVYTFALDADMSYVDSKAIYLYHGHVRVAKVWMNLENQQLELWSNSIREWLTCSEQVSKEPSPNYATSFFKKFVAKHAWLNPQTIAFPHKGVKV